METWKAIDGFAGRYQISDWGRVRESPCAASAVPYARPGRICKPKKTAGGYLSVSLRNGGVRNTLQIHRLVCQAFLGPCTASTMIQHIDWGRTNNRVDNLRYVSRAVVAQPRKPPRQKEVVSKTIYNLLTRPRTSHG